MITKLTTRQDTSREITANITGLKNEPKIMKGYRVVVGTTKGSGMFNYSIGSKIKAQKLGNQMKRVVNNSVFKHKKVYVVLEPCELKKCNIIECDNLCESNDRFCLKCDDLMYEAQMEASEMRAEQMRCEYE